MSRSKYCGWAADRRWIGDGWAQATLDGWWMGAGWVQDISWMGCGWAVDEHTLPDRRWIGDGWAVDGRQFLSFGRPREI